MKPGEDPTRCPFCGAKIPEGEAKLQAAVREIVSGMFAALSSRSADEWRRIIASLPPTLRSPVFSIAWWDWICDRGMGGEFQDELCAAAYPRKTGPKSEPPPRRVLAGLLAAGYPRHTALDRCQVPDQYLGDQKRIAKAIALEEAPPPPRCRFAGWEAWDEPETEKESEE